MRIANSPHHKHTATFDHSAAAVTRTRIEPFCSGQFTEQAHTLILAGGTGTVCARHSESCTEAVRAQVENPSPALC